RRKAGLRRASAPSPGAATLSLSLNEPIRAFDKLLFLLLFKKSVQLNPFRGSLVQLSFGIHIEQIPHRKPEKIPRKELTPMARRANSPIDNKDARGKMSV